MEEAHILSLLLAENACPDPGRGGVGLTELMVNAIEHGNLQITHEEKSRLQARAPWMLNSRGGFLPEFGTEKCPIAFLRNEKTIGVYDHRSRAGLTDLIFDMSPDRGSRWAGNRWRER